MTRLTRPVRREVATLRGMPLVVTLTELGLELREKRRRTSYLLPYGTAYFRAVDLAVQERLRECAARRKRGHA